MSEKEVYHPVRISPSVASFNVLAVGQEIDFISQYFDEIHIDIEDGVAVEGISFGMKMCKAICSLTTAKTSIHLEVIDPLKFLEDVKSCHPDIVFIQADILKDPMSVIQVFQKEGVPVGLAIGDRDRERDYTKILSITKHVLITTAFHDDPDQLYQQTMEDFALKLAENTPLKVWLDGGITLEKANQLRNFPFYALVMGRAIYQNKEKIIEALKESGEKYELDSRSIS